MRIEHKKRRVFFTQVIKAQHQQQMLGDIREISSVINMAVIHGPTLKHNAAPHQGKLLKNEELRRIFMYYG
jgi:methyl coenzyme M reductase subunit D